MARLDSVQAGMVLKTTTNINGPCHVRAPPNNNMKHQFVSVVVANGFRCRCRWVSASDCKGVASDCKGAYKHRLCEALVRGNSARQ